MHFVKMQGAGNDYVYINGMEREIKDPSRLARQISDRHFGIGSDGLVILTKHPQADFAMHMYNADGSEGKMCGNAARCIGKLVYEKGWSDKTDLLLATESGMRRLKLSVQDGHVKKVRVDMGHPSFEARNIPQAKEDDGGLIRVQTCGQSFAGMPVSMGNPHFVILYQDDLETLPLEKIGPVIEHDALFPEGVNVEFVRVLARDRVRVRVWERGSGETLACGSGACAVLAATHRMHVTEDRVQVDLKGGSLQVWIDQDGHIEQEGPATIVFEGEWPEER